MTDGPHEDSTGADGTAAVGGADGFVAAEGSVANEARAAAAAGVDLPTWRQLVGLHGLVSRFAGRLPDALVARARTWLGAEDLTGMAEVLVSSAVVKGLTVTSADAALLAALPAPDGVPRPGLPPELTISDSEADPEVGHRFTVGSSSWVDHAKFVSALYQLPHIAELRLSLRAATDAEPERPVYLVEADPGTPLWRVVAAAQQALGEGAPQVEGYWTGSARTPYQQAAFSASTVLWARPPLPPRGGTVFGDALDPARRKHVTEWYRWEEGVWHTLTGLHRLVRRLAVDLPADLLHDLRRMLAIGELGPLAKALVAVIVEDGVVLTPDESALLRRLPAQIEDDGVDVSGLDRVAVADVPPTASGGHRFASAPSDGWDARFAESSRTLLLLLAGQPGVAKAWRAWDADADRPVFLVEADPGLAVWDVAFDGHLALLPGAGSGTALVEAYWTGDELPPYQQSALDAAELVWADTLAESPFTGGIRSATVHDFADASGQPRFSSEHPRLTDPAECDRLAARMVAGDVIVGNRILATDAVDPSRGRVVPLAYHTDGQWIWRLSTAYYLAEYQLAPDPGLLEHLRAMEHGADRDGDRHTDRDANQDTTQDTGS